jgi:hypothetical protein
VVRGHGWISPFCFGRRSFGDEGRRSSQDPTERIDAPEKGQPFTNRAKQFLSELAFDREVTVETKGQDRYGRTIGEVFLPRGRNLNQEIVKAGLA